MTPIKNMSAKFRAALRNELPIWVQQEIVSEDAAKRISSTYQLDNLKAESSNLLSAVIFTIGALLLGGGLISFVAANWEAIPTPFKLILLFTALLSFHLVGYWLWHSTNWRRLGHALIFCGCLVFGANLGLVAQIFHVSNNWYAGFGAWALGSLVMAWAVRSWIIGVLVLVTSFLWFLGLQNDGTDWATSAYPLMLAVSLLPLAWIIRSRVLYTGTLLGSIAAASVLAGNYGSSRQLLLTMAAGGMFIWALGQLHRASLWRPEFANITSGLGLIVLTVTAYIWSFHWLWSPPAQFGTMWSSWAIVFFALSLAASLVVQRRGRPSQLWLTAGGVVVGGILCASALLAGESVANGEFLFTVTSNLAALLLGALMITLSLMDERRAAFWFGSLYLVLLILSRFLEYETSLLVKSAAFLACGVAVIFAGISYERYLRRTDTPSPAGGNGV
jgi:uncharacterized membrane protein